MLNVTANHDPDVKAHLDKPQQRNAIYISPHAQNEIIDIIGKRMIQKSIAEEVKQACFCSIMVGEVTSHNQEFMPLRVRFVDASKIISQEFSKSYTISNETGETI